MNVIFLVFQNLQSFFCNFLFFNWRQNHFFFFHKYRLLLLWIWWFFTVKFTKKLRWKIWIQPTLKQLAFLQVRRKLYYVISTWSWFLNMKTLAHLLCWRIFIIGSHILLTFKLFRVIIEIITYVFLFLIMVSLVLW